MNFYVGQKVICVESHPEGCVIKGNEYTVTAICSPRCICEKKYGFLLSVDNIIDSKNGLVHVHTRCHCGIINPTSLYNMLHLFRPTRFAPKQTATQKLVAEFTEVKETSDQPIKTKEKVQP